MSTQPASSIFDPAIAAPAVARQLPQARPAPDGPQPGHVRGRGRRRVRDAPLLQGPRRRRAPRRTSSPASSPRGSGSPSSSRTSPRRWPRGAARRRRDASARRAPRRPPAGGSPTATIEEVPSSQLDVGDVVVVTAGEIIPADGDVVEGIASVDESAITGESAPVIRESGGDRCAVTGGTRVLSDEIVVRITARPGETFLDRMIALVEGASRQKTPNEIALDILLAGLTIILLLATVTLQPFAVYSGAEQSVIVLVALLVCLIPTTIGALLSAIGIAGMDRLVQRNVLAMSGRAVEAAGDCSTLLLDKTGTITLGNRQATDFIPAPGVTERGARRRRPALEPRRRDARGPLDRRAREGALRPPRPRAARRRARPVHRPDADERRRHRAAAMIRKGAADAVRRWVEEQGGEHPRRARRRRRRHRLLGRHAARRGRERPRARRRPPQGRRQGGHQRALRRAARDGDPHGHDHRRQPADREGDRRRGRRRRLPRRGDARGQDGADQARAGGRRTSSR